MILEQQKHWFTYPARSVGLIEILAGIGCILISIYAIITGFTDLNNAPETLVGQGGVAIFGLLFIILIGVLAVGGVILLFIGIGMWKLNGFSLWLNILAIALYVGNTFPTLPEIVDLMDSQTVALITACIFGIYLLIVKFKFT